MGIAVAFTNAETKGRSRKRFNYSGEAGSVTTGREGTQLARFSQAKTARGKEENQMIVLAGSPPNCRPFGGAGDGDSQRVNHGCAVKKGADTQHHCLREGKPGEKTPPATGQKRVSKWQNSAWKILRGSDNRFVTTK